MSTSKEEMVAVVQLVEAISETIRELKEVPSGHLYAHLMGKMSLSTYTSIIDILKRAKLVEEENYLLRWIGPDLKD
jgi:hypothetical protein